jgi:hypothetical protein
MRCDRPNATSAGMPERAPLAASSKVDVLRLRRSTHRVLRPRPDPSRRVADLTAVASGRIEVGSSFVITARDQILHIASLDAQDLAGDFDTIPSRQWDSQANAAWLKAADDARLTDSERKTLHEDYIAALVGGCARIVDARSADDAEPDEQTCYFCARSVTTDRAIAEGWAPGFWFNEREAANSPVCQTCAPLHLTDLGGDPVLKASRPSRPDG